MQRHVVVFCKKMLLPVDMFQYDVCGGLSCGLPCMLVTSLTKVLTCNWVGAMSGGLKGCAVCLESIIYLVRSSPMGSFVAGFIFISKYM